MRCCYNSIFSRYETPIILSKELHKINSLVNGPIDRMVKEWRRVLPLCHRCHNRMAKAFNQQIKRRLERTLAYFNLPQRGTEYTMGIPEYIIKMLVKYHSAPTFRKFGEKEYEINMRTITDLAKRERLGLCLPARAFFLS